MESLERSYNTCFPENEVHAISTLTDSNNLRFSNFQVPHFCQMFAYNEMAHKDEDMLTIQNTQTFHNVSIVHYLSTLN